MSQLRLRNGLQQMTAAVVMFSHPVALLIE
jgi:hypothetical protein